MIHTSKTGRRYELQGLTIDHVHEEDKKELGKLLQSDKPVEEDYTDAQHDAANEKSRENAKKK